MKENTLDKIKKETQNLDGRNLTAKQEEALEHVLGIIQYIVKDSSVT